MALIIINILHILKVVFYALVDLLKSWPFVFILLALMFQTQIRDLISKLAKLKVGKDGFEIQKVVEETREYMKDLQELAITLYIPVLDIMSKIGRFDSAPSIEDRLYNRNMILDFMKKHNFNDDKIMQKIIGINSSILFDVLYSIIDNIDHKKHSEIYNLFNLELNSNFTCKPNVNAIKNKLIEYELMDETTIYILFEIENFIKYQDFKDFSKLKECMKQKSRYSKENI